MTLKKNLYLFIAILLLCTSMRAAENYDYTGNFDRMISQLGNPETLSFYLTQATYSCDIAFTQQEFAHLTKLNPGSFVTKSDIGKAYQGLMAKNRFESIAIDMIDDGTGKRIHFTLRANWTFKKVVFKEFWLRQPGYAQLYEQQPGNVFAIDLHDQSIEKLKKLFYDKGYFNCQVIDELVYQKKDKSITVEITVNKGRRFIISDITLTLVDEKKLKRKCPDINLKVLKKTLSQRLASALLGSGYLKSTVEKQALKIKQSLIDDGFLHARIALKKNIQSVHGSAQLAFSITLGKRKLVTFKGNSFFSHQQLEDFAVSSDLPDWLFSPNIITQHIKHEYYHKGYWETKIYAEKKESGTYHFVIQEGKPAIISNILLVDAFSHKQIEATKLIDTMLKGKHCDQDLIEQAIAQLKNMYHEQGYWDFAITEQHFIKDETYAHSYTLKITIAPGLQRLWDGCEIKDYSFIENHSFFRRFTRVNSGHSIPFTSNWLIQQKNYLTTYFHDLGYWYVDVTAQLLETSKTNESIKIFVSWSIETGPQVVFGSTILQGGTTIPFKRIQKQIGIKEGDLWDQKKLDVARKNLKRLGIFKTVHLQGKNLAENSSSKPIVATLVHDDPLELRFRLGYFLTSKNFLFRRQSTPKVGGSVIFKNPSNRADKITFEADWTKFERNVLFDYQQPSLLGFAAMTHLKGYSNKYLHPVEIANSGSAYEAQQHGVALSLTDEYKETYHWGLTLGNEWIETSRVRGDIKFDDKFIDKTLPFFFIEPFIKIDKLDSRINTQKGSLSFVSLKMMIPEKHGDFTAKLLAEQSLFYPLFNAIVAAGRVRFGHIFRGTFNRIPPIERFYLGGPYSVRGYEPDALPPLGTSERNGEKLFTIQGGSSMLNINLELRFPLYQKLGAVLFQDFGVLSQSGLPGFSEPWYPGTGFGLRYQTPIGAVRFDIGWKWKRRLKQDTQSYAWYLTLGEAF